MYKRSTISAGVSIIVRKVSLLYASLSVVSLEMRYPLEFSLGFVASEVSRVFVRTETVIGEVSPTYANRPEVPLKMRPLELSLRFVAIEVSLWRCTKLLPEVSPVLFVCFYRSYC